MCPVYAYNTAITVSVRSVKTLFALSKHCFIIFSNLFATIIIKLSLNDSKTHFIILGSNDAITFDDHRMHSVTEVRYVGAFIA